MGTNDLSDLIPRFDLRGMDLQLDRMQGALEHLGSPCGDIPAIQIAGTNGKGSVAAFLDSALRAGGHRVGLYTSPHLVSFGERIRCCSFGFRYCRLCLGRVRFGNCSFRS